MLPDDDVILLSRYAEERDEAAFTELVRRHLDGVYSAALRRLGGDGQLAEDVVQDVFVALARDAGRLSRHPVLIGWLYTTTRNASANVVRAERRRKARQEEIERMHESLPKGLACEEADWSRLAPVLEQAIDRLKEADRLAVLLRFTERRSFGEIGLALRLTDEAARKRVERSLEKLRFGLARHGIHSSATALGLALTTHAVGAAPAELAASVTGAALATTSTVASVSGATGTLLGFMSTTKLVIGGVAMASIIAALGTLGYEVHARSEVEIELKVAKDKEAGVAANRRSLEEQVNLVERETLRLENAIEEARAAQAATEAHAAAARTEAAKAAAAWDPKKEGLAFLQRHPEAKKALLERSLASYRYEYSALFKALHLTPSQIDQFTLLWSQGDALGTMGPDGKYIMYSLNPEGRDPVSTTKMRELLGPEGSRKFDEYSQILPARELTIQIASALVSSGTPLTTVQSDQLVQIFATNQKKVPGAQIQSIDWEAAMKESADVLSPPQQAALAAMRAKEDLQVAMNTFSPPTQTAPK